MRCLLPHSPRMTTPYATADGTSCVHYITADATQEMVCVRCFTCGQDLYVLVPHTLPHATSYVRYAGDAVFAASLLGKIFIIYI
jgi:hypothetical protein